MMAMAASAIDLLEVEVEQTLLNCSEVELEEVCGLAGLDSKHFKGKSKRIMIKNIRKSYDLEEDHGREAVLKGIQTILQSLKAEVKIGKEEVVIPPITSTPKTETTVKTMSLEETLGRTILKKEFKLNGNITDLKRNDRPSISFISLIHQLEAGQKLGYTDAELIAAVIKAMAPGMRLRTVLETLPDLKMTRLRLMLRCHYQEKSPTDLFQLLSSSIQISEESADEFVIRVYELRQKLIFARKEGSVVPYDTALIQSVFINAIETGLSNESIRNKIRRYLVTPKSGDGEEEFEKINDELIYQTNMAAAAELERSEKIRNNTRRRASASLVETEEEPSVSIRKKTVGFKELEENQMLATLMAIQSQMGTLQTNMDNFSRTRNDGANYRPRPRCQQCMSENQERCSHCFRCGSDNHFARGCKVPSSNSDRRK